MFLLDGVRLLRRQATEPVTWFECAKYVLRASLSWPAHRAWARELASLPPAIRSRPQMLWKLQRPYLHRQLKVPAKLQWLREHHDWAGRMLDPLVLSAAYGPAGTVLARIESMDTPFEVRLSACERFAKEGELVLALWMREERIAAAAFTVHGQGGGWRAYVGCLQGGSGPGTEGVVREATRALHGLRPKQAIAVALYGLLGGLGVHTLAAVSNDRHIYQVRRRRRARVQADYDAFWAELGGVPCADGFALPAQLPRKRLEDVESKRRSQYRRRHELEDRLVAAIQAGCSVPASAPAAPRAAPAEPAAAALARPA